MRRYEQISAIKKVLRRHEPDLSDGFAHYTPGPSEDNKLNCELFLERVAVEVLRELGLADDAG